VRHLSLKHLEQIDHSLGKEQFLLHVGIFQKYNYALFIIQHDVLLLYLHDMSLIVLGFLLHSLDAMAHDHEVLVF
jgi:hypothetical protein